MHVTFVPYPVNVIRLTSSRIPIENISGLRHVQTFSNKLHGADSSLWSWQVLSYSRKFPAFYGNRRFVTAYATARHLSLSWARSVHVSSSHLLKTQFIPRAKFQARCLLLVLCRRISPGPRPYDVLRKFLRRGVVNTSPKPPKLEDNPLPAVRGYLWLQ
jgi:hypothetical protein